MNFENKEIMTIAQPLNIFYYHLYFYFALNNFFLSRPKCNILETLGVPQFLMAESEEPVWLTKLSVEDSLSLCVLCKCKE